MKILRLPAMLATAALCLSSVETPVVFGWGEEGHRFVNEAAVAKLSEEMPAFFRRSAERLAFLGPEPDRWRDNRQISGFLRELNAPDHFIDIDNPEEFRALPDDRYKYSRLLLARGKDPKEVGFLPYACLEGYQKMQVLFRFWRDPRHSGERDQIEQNIIYYAGVMGHYVADGANPLHTTVHYDGWATSWNPEYFTREPLHWRFEGEFVRNQIQLADVIGASKQAAQRMHDPFADLMKFLFDSYSLVPELYRMEKTARWDGNNRSDEAKKFAVARLAAGAQMLANLWYTAWTDSSGGRSQQIPAK